MSSPKPLEAVLVVRGARPGGEPAGGFAPPSAGTVIALIFTTVMVRSCPPARRQDGGDLAPEPVVGGVQVVSDVPGL